MKIITSKQEPRELGVFVCPKQIKSVQCRQPERIKHETILFIGTNDELNPVRVYQHRTGHRWRPEPIPERTDHPKHCHLDPEPHPHPNTYPADRYP